MSFIFSDATAMSLISVPKVMLLWRISLTKTCKKKLPSHLQHKSPSKTIMKEKQLTSQQKLDDKAKPGPRWEKQAWVAETGSGIKDYSTVWLWKNTRMLDNNVKSALFYLLRHGKSNNNCRKGSAGALTQVHVLPVAWPLSEDISVCRDKTNSDGINNCHKIQ